MYKYIYILNKTVERKIKSEKRRHYEQRCGVEQGSRENGRETAKYGDGGAGTTRTTGETGKVYVSATTASGRLVRAPNWTDGLGVAR